MKRVSPVLHPSATLLAAAIATAVLYLPVPCPAQGGKLTLKTERYTKDTLEGILSPVAAVGYTDHRNPPVVLLPDASRKLAFMWSDTPIALHVPFTLSAPEGMHTTLVLDMEVRGLLDTEARAEDVPDYLQIDYPCPGNGSWGLYRPDGKTMPEGITAAYLGGGSRVTRLGNITCVKQPSPTGVIGFPQNYETGGYLLARYQPFHKEHRIIRHRSDEGAFTQWDTKSPVVLIFPPDAPRGLYHFWIAIHPEAVYRTAGTLKKAVHVGDPRARHLPDVLRCTFRAVIFEVRGEAPGVSRDALEIATGQKKRAPNSTINLTDWSRLTDVEADLAVQRNGWILDDIQQGLTAAHAWPLKGRPNGSGFHQDIEGSATVAGNTASFSFKRDVWTYPVKRGAPGGEAWVPEGTPMLFRRATTSYRVTFPRRVPDLEVADVVVAGRLEENPARHQARWSFRLGTAPDALPTPALPGVPVSHLNAGWPDRSAFANRCGAHMEPHWLDPAEETRLEPNTYGDREYIHRFRFLPAEKSLVAGLRKHGAMAFPAGGTGRPGLTVHDTEAFCAGVYRRRSEVESNDQGTSPGQITDSAPAAGKYDGFWEWYATASTNIFFAASEELNSLHTQAALIGLDIADMAKKHRILTAAFNADSDIDSTSIKNRQQQRLVQIGSDLETARRSMDPLVARAEELCDVIIADINKQAERSRKARRERPNLAHWRTAWEERKQMVGAYLFLAAGDMNRFRESLDWEGKAYPSHVHAQFGTMFSEMGLRLEALGNFRRAVRIDPTNNQARRSMAALELELVRAVARKTGGDVARARVDFMDYIGRRGLSTTDIGWLESEFETLWFVTMNGPTAAMNVWQDRTRTLGETSSSIQHAGTVAFMGVQGIIALLKTGRSLEDIVVGKDGKGMDGGTLAEHLRLRRLGGGGEYAAVDYAKLGAAIRQAGRLPEIQALLTLNPADWQTAMSTCSFDLDDVSVYEIRAHAIEDYLDVFTARNVAMTLLPFSVGSVGGRLVGAGWWGTGTQAARAMTAAETAGLEILTGQEVLADMLFWGKACRALSSTPTGGRLLTLLDTSHKYRTGGSTARKVVWTFNRMVADFAAMSFILETAETYGGRHLAAAVETYVAMFVYDPDLCYSMLRRARVPRKKVAEVVGKYADEFAEAERQYQRHHGRTGPAAEVVALDRAGQAQDAAALALARDHLLTETEKVLKLEKVFGHFVPCDNLWVMHDYALYNVLRSYSRGDHEEMRRATLAIFRLQYRLKKELDAAQAKLVNLDELLAQMPADLAAHTAGYSVPLRFTLRQEDELVTDAVRSLNEADYLVLQGRLDLAVAKYRGAMLEFELSGGTPEIAAEIQAKYRFALELRDQLDGYQRLPAGPGKPVDREKMLAASREVNSGNRLTGDQKSFNRVHDVTVDGQRYAVKYLEPIRDADRVVTLEWQRDSAMVETVAPELADLFNAHLTAVRARPIRGSPDGDILRYEVVSLWQNGISMDKLSAAEIIGVKDQIADHRVFSMILGNYDCKLDNYILDMDTRRLVALDPGAGRLVPARRIPLPNGAYAPELDNAALVQECADHWYRRAHFAKTAPNPAPWLDNQILLERSLVWQDLLPAIKRAEQLFSSPAGLEEIKRRVRRGLSQVIEDADELARATEVAVQEMTERVRALRSIDMDGTFPGVPRNGFPRHAECDWGSTRPPFPSIHRAPAGNARTGG